MTIDRRSVTSNQNKLAQHRTASPHITTSYRSEWITQEQLYFIKRHQGNILLI